MNATSKWTLVSACGKACDLNKPCILGGARALSLLRKRPPLLSWFIGLDFPLQAEISATSFPVTPSNQTRQSLSCCSRGFVIACEACSNPYFKIFKGHLENICESEKCFVRVKSNQIPRLARLGSVIFRAQMEPFLQIVHLRAPAQPQVQGRWPRRPWVWVLLG